nr:hypothetical protein CFP56_66993 [Quercus suber]
MTKERYGERDDHDYYARCGEREQTIRDFIQQSESTNEKAYCHLSSLDSGLTSMLWNVFHQRELLWHHWPKLIYPFDTIARDERNGDSHGEDRHQPSLSRVPLPEM